MHMKIHILRLAVLASALVLLQCVAHAETEVLWWQVGSKLEDDTYTLDGVNVTTFHEGVKSAAELGVTEARIRVVGPNLGEDTYLTMVSVDGISDPAMPVPTDWYASVVAPYADAAYSFAIELGNWDWADDKWTMIATSEVVSYTTLKTAGHIAEWDGINPSAPAVWQAATYTVPEPTGGLLFVVGGALLALRRRRRRAGE